MIGSFDGTNTTYYLTDAQGSVLTSFSQSAVTGEQIYGPYGNTRYTAGTLNVANQASTVNTFIYTSSGSGT